MRDALQATVCSPAYIRKDFVGENEGDSESDSDSDTSSDSSDSDNEDFDESDDPIKKAILGEEKWAVMESVIKVCGPLLKLLRLADGQKGALTKLQGTVLYVKHAMQEIADTAGAASIKADINAVFLNRYEDLLCEYSMAAFVVDPQFLEQSRRPGDRVMNAFWKVARNVLRVDSEEEWLDLMPLITVELDTF